MAATLWESWALLPGGLLMASNSCCGPWGTAPHTTLSSPSNRNGAKPTILYLLLFIWCCIRHSDSEA